MSVFQAEQKLGRARIVVEINGNKVLLMIPEFAIITQVKFKIKPKLEDKIKLKVSSIDLSERSVDFKPL